MDINPYGTGGPALYRIRLGVRVGSKVVAWIQRRVWRFFWRDWAPMSNASVTIGNRIIDQYAFLQDLVREYEAVASHEAAAIKFVEQSAGDDGISKPFRGPKRPKEVRLPDNAEEVAKVIKALKQGTEERRGRLMYDTNRLTKPKPDPKKGGSGPRSVYTEAELNQGLDALNRSWAAESADFKVPFKGLHDNPNSVRTDKGNQNQKKQQPNQQGQKDDQP